MIKGKVLLGMVAGFSVGTLLGALFATGRKDKTKPADKKDKPAKSKEDEVVIKY